MFVVFNKFRVFLLIFWLWLVFQLAGYTLSSTTNGGWKLWRLLNSSPFQMRLPAVCNWAADASNLAIAVMDNFW